MGTIVSFYSYKGGVGRTLTVANVAVALARRGLRILAIDWDLEAPGLQRYFSSLEVIPPSAPGGLVAMLREANKKALRAVQREWRHYLTNVQVGESAPLQLLLSGREHRESAADDGYDRTVAEFDWEHFFADRNGGEFIESFRAQMQQNYDVVLIDSRTGITDSNGICTILLPDVLVTMFTANEQSLDGAVEVATRAQISRQRLAVDRMPLLIVPILSRFDARTEYEESTRWLRIIADRTQPFYKDWVPKDVTALQVLERTKLPYIPFFSFGEKLPVLSQGVTDPEGLGFALNEVAELIARDFKEVPKVAPYSTELVEFSRELSWWSDREEEAKTGLRRLGINAYCQATFALSLPKPKRSQVDLLAAARSSTIDTFGWPIGVVIERDEYRPRPRNDGIYTEIARSEVGAGGVGAYDYWALRENGDFYLLQSLFEDQRVTGSIFLDTRVVRTTEILLYCARLYERLRVPDRTSVRIRIEYAGLRGRYLRTASPLRLAPSARPTDVDGVDAEIVTRLGEINLQLVDLVRQLTSPLFVVFDFFQLSDPVYSDLIDSFRNGRIG